MYEHNDSCGWEAVSVYTVYQQRLNDQFVFSVLDLSATYRWLTANTRAERKRIDQIKDLLFCIQSQVVTYTL